MNKEIICGYPMLNKIRRSQLSPTALLISCLAYSASFVDSIQSAEIIPSSSEHCKLLLTGQIESGDLEKVKAAVEASGFSEALKGEDGAGDPTASLCLDSQGGSYIEGVDIAQLLYLYGIATVVDSGMECLSACALIFMAGRTYAVEEDYINRRLHIRAKLGFHAPYLVVPQAQYSPSTVEQAYRAAIVAISKFLNLANKIGTFSSKPHIKASLVEDMLLRSKDDMLLIDNVDKAGRWEIALFGYEPLQLSKVAAGIACNNFISWHADRYSAPSNADYQENYNYSDITITAEAYTGNLAHVLEGDLIHVDRSGMEAEWCDVVRYSTSPDEEPLLSICAISGDLQYGNDCNNKSEAFGLLNDAYVMFDPAKKLIDLPLRSSGSSGNMNSATVLKAEADPKLFLTRNSRDMTGGDHSILRGIDLQSCEARCKLESRCKAYTFDEWNGICFLKSSVGVLRRDPRSLTGVLLSVTTEEDSRPEVIQKRRSKAFPDHPYSEIKVGNFDQCSESCLADDRCDGFNFGTVTRLCSLIESPKEYSDSPLGDVGVKMQPP